MSTEQTTEPESDKSGDVWAKLAERREALEMCVKEDVPFADRAEKLLERIEEEGY